MLIERNGNLQLGGVVVIQYWLSSLDKTTDIEIS